MPVRAFGTPDDWENQVGAWFYMRRAALTIAWQWDSPSLWLTNDMSLGSPGGNAGALGADHTIKIYRTTMKAQNGSTESPSTVYIRLQNTTNDTTIVVYSVEIPLSSTEYHTASGNPIATYTYTAGHVVFLEIKGSDTYITKVLALVEAKID